MTPHFLPRSNELDELKRRLLDKSSKPVAVTGVGSVGVQGMGGIGKTVLASALVHDSDVQGAFPDGIYWITVGQHPNIVDLQNELLYKITRAPAVSVGQVKDALREALAGQRSLVVLDDVWNVEHAHAFRESCAPARLLVTTRNKPVLVGIGAVEHRVGVLAPEDAIALLASWALEDEAAPLPPQAGAIAKECGYLPLALAAIGAMIRLSPTAWADALTRLQRADLAAIERASPHYPYPDLLRALAVSIDALDGPDRERYLDLAIFPEDQPIPERVLSELWGVDGLATRDCMRRLVARSLASDAVASGCEALMLHDLQRDVIRKQREATLPDIHLRLVRNWDAMPKLLDAYAWRWAIHHLARAGRMADVRRLLLDFDYLQAKLEAAGPNALIADYDDLDDTDLRVVQSALRLSAHVLAVDPWQLAGQLIGRLLDNQNAECHPAARWRCSLQDFAMAMSA
ncbi:MAG: hypothetical protein QOI11_2229 [Candidatus Eremiobacteraeota bacterium]|nr:hypothetical protein [Candidatus Eremiobacteraeota bacterium]